MPSANRRKFCFRGGLALNKIGIKEEGNEPKNTEYLANAA